MSLFFKIDKGNGKAEIAYKMSASVSSIVIN